ncbi:hypothetical protein HAX54_023645 [Datura stramonium]|uniref:Uncharacterized protein n=1 Tax=Datura stramonium TaxID=4076 RepID=A0ABS8UWW0_DATST|nr:hypothetical protein [Datura stramonium]
MAGKRRRGRPRKTMQPVSSRASTDSSDQLKRDSPVPIVPLPEQKEDNWTRLFSSNRATANGLALKYVTPEVVN